MLTTIGYAVCAVGYIFLLLLLFTVRKSGLAKYLLILATASTCLWAIVPFWLSPMTIEQLLLFDNIKNFFWLLFIASCLKDNFKNIGDVLCRVDTWLILALPIAAFVLLAAGVYDRQWEFLIQTMIALEVLVLLEVMYRQAGDNAWALKPLVLYLAATSIFEFVTFANALMVEHIHYSYIAARGYIYTAFIPFLILAIRRVKTWGVEIYISREVVMHSTLLMVAGGYLFIMALIGYAVQYFGGEWSTTIQIVLVALSLALLGTLFLSLSFRTKIKVFITKHFFANQFDYRNEWLKLTQCLDEGDPDGNVYATGLRGFIQAFDYRQGNLIKLNNGRLEVLAHIDSQQITANERTVLLEFCDFFQTKNWIVDIEELRVKPFMYEGLKVNHALLNDVSFQLVIPMYKEDALWGLVAIKGDDNTNKKLNWELRDYLTVVNAQISNFIFHHLAAQELAENAQFSAFTRMSAFVVHDLKNVLAQIDLILCNAEQHKDNPEFIEDTFETLHHTKARMDKMLRQLTEKNTVPKGAESLVVLSHCIEQVIEQRCGSYLPKPSLQIIDELPVVLDQDKLSNVMYHLISNAQQATSDQGEVKVSVDKSLDEQFIIVKIIDNGSGMSDEFIRTRLFKPFDTTKGNAGMGIGAFDAKAYLEKIGGQLLVNSEEQVGSIFTLRIPAH
ncbi:XrtA/PEP-CTERM system histidine kinase PrsK [Paraglaciecola sp. L3A3]|uniref:XrtA/PEP-CTERM system histidine kinase PrsK n=1 Tax=Paraglaciecola sp. L3A3 TaxID=2686358 RepID=UPI00131BCF50|nr:XrtA/PEP-CTERM system histidine kinase PrsK [Paraglaciecola sp. L3A3]